MSTIQVTLPSGLPQAAASRAAADVKALALQVPAGRKAIGAMRASFVSILSALIAHGVKAKAVSGRFGCAETILIALGGNRAEASSHDTFGVLFADTDRMEEAFKVKFKTERSLLLDTVKVAFHRANVDVFGKAAKPVADAKKAAFAIRKAVNSYATDASKRALLAEALKAQGLVLEDLSIVATVTPQADTDGPTAIQEG